jgi:hypothetical protein
LANECCEQVLLLRIPGEKQPLVRVDRHSPRSAQLLRLFNREISRCAKILGPVELNMLKFRTCQLPKLSQLGFLNPRVQYEQPVDPWQYRLYCAPWRGGTLCIQHRGYNCHKLRED